MRKNLRHHRIRRIKHAPPGTAPGAINVPDDALNLKIRSFVYDQESVLESELYSIDDIKLQLKNNPLKIHWFDIKGFCVELLIKCKLAQNKFPFDFSRSALTGN